MHTREGEGKQQWNRNTSQYTGRMTVVSEGNITVKRLLTLHTTWEKTDLVHLPVYYVTKWTYPSA